MSFKKRLQQGKSAEGKIANWLRLKCGYSVVPIYEIAEGQYKGPQVFTPNTELVAPDMFVFRANKVRWIEAKHKSIFSWFPDRRALVPNETERWTTGIDKRHYRDYLRIALESPWPVWLLFYHTGTVVNKHGEVSPTGLFGNDLIDLQDRIDHDSPRWGNGGMVYWAHRDLIELATCSEVESADAQAKRTLKAS